MASHCRDAHYFICLETCSSACISVPIKWTFSPVLRQHTVPTPHLAKCINVVETYTITGHGSRAVQERQLSVTLDCPVLSLSCPFSRYPEGMTSFHYLLSSALIASFLEQTLAFCSVFLCSFVQHSVIWDQFWFLTCLSLVWRLELYVYNY